MCLKNEDLFAKLSFSFIKFHAHQKQTEEIDKNGFYFFTRLPKKPCLRFLECASFLFLQANIFGDEKLYPPPVNYYFEMKRGIKIRRHGFAGNPSVKNWAKFQPNWSRGCRLGVQNACTTRPNFQIEKQGKIEFLAVPGRQANKVLITKRNNISLTGNKKPTNFRSCGKLSC